MRRLTLVADATALPAVQRIATQVPSDVEVRLFCEVVHEDDAHLPDGDRVRAVWLPRSGNGLFPSRVAEACTEVEVALDGSETVWVAGEAAMTRAGPRTPAAHPWPPRREPPRRRLLERRRTGPAGTTVRRATSRPAHRADGAGAQRSRAAQTARPRPHRTSTSLMPAPEATADGHPARGR
ncbi:SIP domain-containing protein [Streptomyces sp. NPDC127068]|uniref:SIP domain-containing protein n=1 Tax=Streptomyces sp. NPDC127068 TaxID=3347127 RepID=UPI0036620BD2